MLSPEMLEQRLSYLTGTDSSIICGCNQYQTPVQLWQYKTRRATQEDISHKPVVMAGNMLEASVASWFSYVTGKQLIESEVFHVHKTIPILGGNIDRLVAHERAIFEAKTTQSERGWGAGYEHGDNTIPDAVLCQVIHYLAVTDLDVAYVAVLIRGLDFRWFKFERDKVLEAEVIRRELEFWNLYVIGDRCPPPQTAEEVMQILDGKVSDDVAQANGEIQNAIDELRVTREQIDLLESAAELLKDKICIYLNEKQTLLNLDGTVAVRWNKRKGATRFDLDAFKKALPDLYSQFTSCGKDTRTFKLIQGQAK